jgi:SAM-dependent methyltransferase
MSARVPDPSTAAGLRGVLGEANFSTPGLMLALGGEPESDPGSAPVQARSLGDTPLDTLARLFFLGVAVDEGAATTALAPVTVDELVEAGWLLREGAAVRSPLRITPFEDLLLAHDPLEGGAPPADVVLGPTPAARTLACLTPRGPVEAALDVGTGCGMHALLAARHAGRVVATDVNPRALALGELSAALSGIGNVEFREGSFFDPVAGERFDLITSNPPYVISPEGGPTYRGGALGRDDVSRELVTGAAAALAPEGLAQLLVNWIHRPFASWAAPLEEWLEGAGCDALILHHATETPLEYAAKWNAALREDPVAHEEALDRWLTHFDQEGITSLATGAVTLRRTSRTPPLMVHQEMASGPRGAAGEHVVRLLDAAEWLAETGDEELLRTPLKLVDGHTIVSRRVHAGGEYQDDTVAICLDDSAGLDDTVGPAAAAVLMGLQGGETPADALPGLAAAVHDVPTDPRELVADMARALVGNGVLVRRES